MYVIDKQLYGETPFLIRGKDKGRPAWHYILVPFEKAAIFRGQKKGADVDVTEYGRIIKYKDDSGHENACSGWGEDPPKKVTKWIWKHYGKW